MDKEILLACRDAGLGYEGKAIWEHLDFQVRRGDYICIVGENGSGKSTLLKILQGGHKPNGGTITYDGNNPLANHRFFQKYIGYVPQDNPLFANLTVMDNLKLWYCDSSRDLKQDIESGIIKDFKIDSFIKSKVANLSGGMKKRLSIIFPTSVTIVCLPICTHCFLFPRNSIYSSKECLSVRL